MGQIARVGCCDMSCLFRRPEHEALGGVRRWEKVQRAWTAFSVCIKATLNTCQSSSPNWKSEGHKLQEKTLFLIVNL